MTEGSLSVLVATAALIGMFHTATGPDHYIPFIAMARVRRWSLARTLTVTLACGLAHVLSSVAIGVVGILLGWAVTVLEWLEGLRGELAGWLLLAFGLAYMAWGLWRGATRRPHRHWHAHTDGTLHKHPHRHETQTSHLQSVEHAHQHAGSAETSSEEGGGRLTPWVLFTIFALGPCEPLIPVLMYPAAESSWWGVALVAVVFSACTLGTMTMAVLLGYQGLSRLSLGVLERYSHALAGLALLACGVAIQLGL